MTTVGCVNIPSFSLYSLSSFNIRLSLSQFPFSTNDDAMHSSTYSIVNSSSLMIMSLCFTMYSFCSWLMVCSSLGYSMSSSS